MTVQQVRERYSSRLPVRHREYRWIDLSKLTETTTASRLSAQWSKSKMSIDSRGLRCFVYDEQSFKILVEDPGE